MKRMALGLAAGVCAAVLGTAATALADPGNAGDFLPGEGQLVYVAGHRTTFSAPFSHLDRLRSGDAIAIALPYGTFTYTVTGHRIVTANDIAVLRSHRHEQLILQTCHPRFSATHRYLVFARPKGERHAARRHHQ
jgi:LPXTG-site transpeptidase (sortase) family protein